MHSSLLEQTRGIDGCDVYVCGDADLEGVAGHMPAGGRSLPEQIAGAVSALFEGYERVVLLAGDVCGLQRHHVADALRHLDGEGARATVGRSVDGGFYLAAFNRSPDLNWAALSWFRPTVGSELVEALQTIGFEVAVVAQLADVDDAGDARRIVGTFKNIPLQLRAILYTALVGFLDFKSPAWTPAFATPLHCRPPPALL